jgi:hypothetical protein
MNYIAQFKQIHPQYLEYVKTTKEFNEKKNNNLYEVSTWECCFYTFIKDKINIDDIGTKDILILLSVISKMHLDNNEDPEFYPDCFTLQYIVNSWNLFYNLLLENGDICSDEEAEEEDLQKSITMFSNARNLKSTCQGCVEEQPNQQAHMDFGGCLYE